MIGGKYYVGRMDQGKQEVFEAAEEPTQESHPKYWAVVGPFDTRWGARVMESWGSYNNPHLQCVEDAERIAREEINKLRAKIYSAKLQFLATCATPFDEFDQEVIEIRTRLVELDFKLEDALEELEK